MSATNEKFENEKPEIDLTDDFTEHQMPARQANTLHPSKNDLKKTEPGQQCASSKNSCDSKHEKKDA